MAFSAHMKIDGIPGPLTSPQYVDCIIICSFRLGTAQPVSITASSAGGATAEQANFPLVTISKQVDVASPKLWEASFTGRHIKEIVIDMDNFVIKMEQVLIVNFDQAPDDWRLIEKVSFSPGKITMDYTHRNIENGEFIRTVSAGWNSPANEVAWS